MHRRHVLAGIGGLWALSAAGCSTAGPAGKAVSGETNHDAAFFYAFPLYEMARLGQNRTAPPGGQFNTAKNRAVLLDHTSRQVTGPNNDTIYTSCQLELSGGPVEVFSPTDTKRYFSIAFMDAFTDNFAYVGTRATKGQGGRFWVVGPQWTGTAPAGVTLLRSSTNDVWMLGRILVDGPDDLRAAAALQQQIKVTPTFSTPAKRFSVPVTKVEDPANFLGVVNDMLARSPGGKGQTARAGRFASLGIGAEARAVSPDVFAAWGSYIPTGLAKLREKFLFPGPGLKVNGWDYQPKGVGDFGTDDLLRAAVALGGIAAMTEDEAMYFHATTDGANAPLTGLHSYKWRLPPGGVPVDAFWSLTMYQAEDDGRYFLVDNPIRRYSIGDRTPGLVKNPDGSIDIMIQHNAPAGPLAANWLPAPAGKMAMSLRAYLPRKQLRDRNWHVPPLEQVT
jgi:hypothetical protein